LNYSLRNSVELWISIRVHDRFPYLFSGCSDFPLWERRNFRSGKLTLLWNTSRLQTRLFHECCSNFVMLLSYRSMLCRTLQSKWRNAKCILSRSMYLRRRSFNITYRGCFVFSKEISITLDINVNIFFTITRKVCTFIDKNFFRYQRYTIE